VNRRHDRFGRHLSLLVIVNDLDVFGPRPEKYPNQAGENVGVYGLVNVLGRDGMLTPDGERFRQDNAWYDAAYPNPVTEMTSRAGVRVRSGQTKTVVQLACN
jgi:hypothetical protein